MLTRTQLKPMVGSGFTQTVHYLHGRHQSKASDPRFRADKTHSRLELDVSPTLLAVVQLGCSSPRSSTRFAFGTRTQLFEAGLRILATEDEDVAVATLEHSAHQAVSPSH